jgi:hypothetical protein
VQQPPLKLMLLVTQLRPLFSLQRPVLLAELSPCQRRSA